jgi:hypothetical protein
MAATLRDVFWKVAIDSVELSERATRSAPGRCVYFRIGRERRAEVTSLTRHYKVREIFSSQSRLSGVRGKWYAVTPPIRARSGRHYRYRSDRLQ